MDVNAYVIEHQVRIRLEEARAAAARRALVAEVRGRRISRVRVTLGVALIGLGQRLLGKGVVIQPYPRVSHG
jgi:hypothetical protein